MLKFTHHCIQETHPKCHLRRFSDLETISSEVFGSIRNILSEESTAGNLISNVWDGILREIRRQEGMNFLSKYFQPDAIDYYRRHKKNTIYEIKKGSDSVNLANAKKHKYIYSNKEIVEEIRMGEPLKVRNSQGQTKETSKNNVSHFFYI